MRLSRHRRISDLHKRFGIVDGEVGKLHVGNLWELTQPSQAPDQSPQPTPAARLPSWWR
jgi:hypothetical protein